MKSGERMFFAAVYAERRGLGKSVIESLRLAALAVKEIRTAAHPTHAELFCGDADALAMLADMLSTGADR